MGMVKKQASSVTLPACFLTMEAAGHPQGDAPTMTRCGSIGRQLRMSLKGHSTPDSSCQRAAALADAQAGCKVPLLSSELITQGSFDISGY